MLNSLLIVDGNSIASRAFPIKQNYFFSLIHKIFLAQNGRWPTIDGMVVVFDDPYTDSWRKELYPPYKAQREVDLEKRAFVDKLYDSAVSLALAVMRWPEADDAIASLSVSDVAEHKIIYSGDKDMFALVQEEVHLVGFERIVIDGRSKWEKAIYDLADIKTRFGSTPQQVMDYKALAGDSSDNIPGVEGIGEKTAKKLLGKYHDLAGIYDNLHELSASARDKLTDQEELARISQKLAQMDFNVPLPEFDPQALAWTASPQGRGAWANVVLS